MKDKLWYDLVCPRNSAQNRFLSNIRGEVSSFFAMERGIFRAFCGQLLVDTKFREFGGRLLENGASRHNGKSVVLKDKNWFFLEQSTINF